MIIGNGLIATAFRYSNINHDNLTIYASGVSKSKESRIEEYNREYALIQEHIYNNKFIYFSSCSVLSNIDTEYSRHKKNIENYIQRQCKDYLILRLPNIVGIPNNNSQLLNYMYYSLINQNTIKINIDCIRHLIDVEDLPKIVQILNDINIKPKIVNIAFDNGITLDKVVDNIETVVGLKFKKVELYKGGSDYIVDTAETKNYIKDIENYNTIPENIIKKYYKKYEN